MHIFNSLNNMKRILLASAVALMASMVFVGCSDDDKEGTAQVPATGVSLDVTEQTLDIGQTLQLTATPAPVNTTDRVVWRSDKESVATVSETGVVKAVAAGTATVEAVCGTVSASCVVRVIDPYQEYDVISFETSEGLMDINGELLVLGDVEVVGGDAAATHKNVFWGKSYVSIYGQQDQYGSTYIDLPLFGTPDDNVWFGSYYSDGGSSKWDTWAGFVLSQNCNTTATSFDFANQFSVYAESGACSTETFAVAYYSSMSGYLHTTPTIEFISPRKVAYLYMAPSTLLDTYYKYDSSAVKDRTFSYRITGSLDNASTGTVDVTLVKNGTVEAGWVKVDLSSLGSVDKLTFTPQGIDPSKDFDPAYFCLDHIELVKE